MAQATDVVIIGSGFGGGVSAYALSRAGLRVVLIERGGWPRRDDDDWNARQILLDKRYRSDCPVIIDQDEDHAHVHEYPNEMVGGNSVLFGAATLRLRQNDFNASWPITYADLEPYYTLAENLFEVHGAPKEDPYEPPRSAPYPFDAIELTAPAQRIFRAAERLGLRPFRVPVAINHRNPARTICSRCFTCDGFPCKIEAKNDVTTTALKQARHDFLDIRERVIAVRLVQEAGRVTAVECIDRRDGTRSHIHGRAFIVSGGALQSPALLLRSGLAELDESQLLGRNLMRHCNAVVGCLFPFRTNPQHVNHKQVGISHFYEDMRERTGTAVGIIQDMCMPPADAVRHMAPRGVRTVAGMMSGYLQSMICIAEDRPQPENRVTLAEDERDPHGLPLLHVHHRYLPEDRERRDYLIRHARRVLRKAGGLVSQVKHIASFSHAVGSVRFGADPRTSVLDRDCRFWALPNLFVVDGSFMPSSGGVNPSLTIAANALRAAERMVADFPRISGASA